MVGGCARRQLPETKEMNGIGFKNIISRLWLIPASFR